MSDPVGLGVPAWDPSDLTPPPEPHRIPPTFWQAEVDEDLRVVAFYAAPAPVYEDGPERAVGRSPLALPAGSWWSTAGPFVYPRRAKLLTQLWREGERNG